MTLCRRVGRDLAGAFEESNSPDEDVHEPEPESGEHQPRPERPARGLSAGCAAKGLGCRAHAAASGLRNRRQPRIVRRAEAVLGSDVGNYCSAHIGACHSSDLCNNGASQVYRVCVGSHL